MKYILKMVLSIFLLIAFLLLISSCSLIIVNTKVYKDKNEIISTVKNNIIELNNFADMLNNRYTDSEPLIIESKIILKFNSEVNYTDALYEKIISKFKLKAIRINSTMTRNDKGRIIFEALKEYNATYCGFYYSKNDNKYYNIDNDNSISNNNWTIHFFQEKSGWYTEKICDNWYYYEEDWEQFNFLNYIKDDLKQLDVYPKIYNRFKEYFVEDKDFVYSTTSSLPKE